MNRRTEILRRAAELFADLGVANTSMERIAKAVGVKREAIYYYFKSRHDILLEVLLPSSKSLLTGLRNIQRTDMTSVEKLRAAIENHLASFDPTYLEMSIALREQHFFADTSKLGQLQDTWNEYSDHWTELVREGQVRGEFRDGLDAKMVAFGILGMCNWLSRWFDPAKDTTIDEIIETYFTIASNGLSVPAPNLAAE
jgi:AcrR family transcriptional regulator